MNEKRQFMVDQIIRKYGFEHKKTIVFAHLCEYTLDAPVINKYLEKVFNEYMNESEVEE